MTIDFATLDGVTPFTLDGDAYSWRNGFIDSVDAFYDGPGPHSATLGLAGDFYVRSLFVGAEFDGDLTVEITDDADGGDRGVGFLELNGDVTVDLVGATRVRALQVDADAPSATIALDGAARIDAAFVSPLTMLDVTGAGRINLLRTEAVAGSLSGGGRVDFLSSFGDSTLDLSGAGRIVTLRSDGTADLALTDEARIGDLDAFGDAIVSMDGDSRIGAAGIDGLAEVSVAGNARITGIEMFGGGTLATSGQAGIGAIIGGRSVDLTLAGRFVNTVTLDGNFDGAAAARHVVRVGDGASGSFVGNVTMFGREGDSSRIFVEAGADVRSIGVSDGTDLLSVAGQVDTAGLGAGGDRLFVEAGGRIGLADLGSGENLVVVRDGDASMVRAGGGDDTIRAFGDGRIDSAILGDGDNVFLGAGGFVETVTAYGGADNVTIREGGAGSVATNGGADRLIVVGEWVEFASLGEGEDLARITGDGGIGALRTGDGADLVDLRTGNVSSLHTGEGDDLVRAGRFGLGDTWLGDGDDEVVVDLLQTGRAISVSGGQGTDTLNFTPYNRGVEFSLERPGEWQNIEVGRGIDDAGARYVRASSLENLTGSRNADVLTGGAGDNVLVGERGADVLTGLGGADEFVIVGGDRDDTITDFALGEDVIRLQQAAAFGDIGFAAEAGGVRVSAGNSDVLVEGVSVVQMDDAANFVF